MAVEPKKYIRKPLYVDAVRITAANFDEVVAWCQGEVLQDEVPGKGTTKKFIKVRVHNPKNVRQTKAFVGDWLLYTERGYKVYTNKAFHASFDLVVDNEVDLEAAKHGIVTGTQELAPGITLTQAIQQLRSVPPATLDLIRQLQNVGYTLDQIADHLGLSPEVVRIIESDGRQPNNVESVSEQEKVVPAAVEGKRVLSVAEQKELTADEVRELVQSGEAVLAQDIPEA